MPNMAAYKFVKDAAKVAKLRDLLGYLLCSLQNIARELVIPAVCTLSATRKAKLGAYAILECMQAPLTPLELRSRRRDAQVVVQHAAPCKQVQCTFFVGTTTSNFFAALQSRVRKAFNELNIAIDGWQVGSCACAAAARSAAQIAWRLCPVRRLQPRIPMIESSRLSKVVFPCRKRMMLA